MTWSPIHTKLESSWHLNHFPHAHHRFPYIESVLEALEEVFKYKLSISVVYWRYILGNSQSSFQNNLSKAMSKITLVMFSAYPVYMLLLVRALASRDSLNRLAADSNNLQKTQDEFLPFILCYTQIPRKIKTNLLFMLCL